MMERSLREPPFGRLRLPSYVESFRSAANKLSDGALSRRVMSVARRICLAGRSDPIDIDLFHGGRARLYPRSNRCEKRVFLGVNSWDARERAVIAEELLAAQAGRPFIFVDGGANVGLYTLFVLGEAQRHSKDCMVIAIEPDPQNLGRLQFNIAATGAGRVKVVPVALGAEAGRSVLLSEQSNRGEVRLASGAENDTGGIAVSVEPLASVLAAAGAPHVDVLKLDIEGAELSVLRAFFADAPRALWPSTIILEIARGGHLTEAAALCISSGYAVREKTHLNAILHLEARADAAHLALKTTTNG